MTKGKNLHLALVIFLNLLFVFATAASAVEKTALGSSGKIVKGLSGEVKTIARQWLKKNEAFVSIEFKPGNKGRFGNMGILSGRLKDGQGISMEVEDDFSRRNPGMIIDHLNALRYKVKISAFTPGEWKKQLVRKRRSRWKIEREKIRVELRIQHEVERKLKVILEKELSEGEQKIFELMKKEFEPQMRLKMAAKIRSEVEKEFLGADRRALEKAVSKKVNEEMEERIDNALNEKIANENPGFEAGTGAARKIIQQTINKHKQRITMEVRAKYTKKRREKLERLKKIARGEIVVVKEK